MPDLNTIVRAAIHPAIGVARVGNSPHGYFIGPEVPDAPTLDAGEYKDEAGRLKRQVARFRVYGFNAAGEVVAELTAQNAEIEWTVHLANKKSAWYQFHLAMDLPEASDPSMPSSARRNAFEQDRRKLIIDPGPRSVSGQHSHGVLFDTGKSYDFPVPLGELRTDEAGRLLVFGGLGLSQSLDGCPPETFANNDKWHDDISDGPIDAIVKIGGKEIPTEGAWVVVGPPNYAPALKTVRTLYDLLLDRMVAWGYETPPSKVYLHRHVVPIFERLTGLQWVNQGFAAWFGAGAPFQVDALLPRLADKSPGNREFRSRILEQFRSPYLSERQLGKNLWPQFYGDALDELVGAPSEPDPTVAVPHAMASLSSLQLEWLRKWEEGKCEVDEPPPRRSSLGDFPLQEQPRALDEAALAFCLADAFHPGCELTWIMRIPHLYSGFLRIKRRPPSSSEPDFGPILTPEVAVSATGPLNGSAAGDLTKWMAVPWQTDTASCLSGYGFFRTSPSLPTFWPARVPNDVLRLREYQVVMDESQPPAVRLAAFNHRFDWFRGFAGTVKEIARMIREFHKLGIIEQQRGPTNLPGVPSAIWVESPPDLPEPDGDQGPTSTAAETAPAKTFAGRTLRQFGRYGLPPE